MKLNKANIFIVIIAALCLSVTASFNACSPLETKSNSSRSGGNGLGGDGGGGTAALTAGKNYFTENIEPIVRSSTCIGCHGSPREITVPISEAGPILYESYRRLQLDLVDGSSATNNYVYNMVTNSAGLHPGGNKCNIFGASESPCKEFIEWFQIEKNSNSSIPGLVTVISALGRIEGWAVDFADDTRSVQVRFYDGPNNQGGTQVGTTQANQLGPSGGFSGNHAFVFQIPNNMRDGTQRQLYAYGVDSSGNEVELGGSPYTVVAYIPSQASIDFYNNTVGPAFNNRCNGCHVYSFDDAFGRLLNPTPFDGGSATNNRLFRYANGQVSHPGGNACGGNCGLQQWFNINFN